MKRFNCNLLLFVILTTNVLFAWESEIVYKGEDGKLVYIADEEGNRIPDFSYAGYMGGGVELPDVPVVKTISPVEGDNTYPILVALSELVGLPKDKNGFRGALKLEAGVYEIAGTINIKYDGIVLRGAGDGTDPENNTILLATGNSPKNRTVIIAGGGGATDRWRSQVSGTKTNITTEFIPVGSRSFQVEDVSQYAVGDNIIINHPCTDAWLQAIDYGGTESNNPGAEQGVDVPWEVNSQPIIFNRYITKIELPNTIYIDAPVFNHIDTGLSPAYIYKFNRSGLKTHIGIENLRIDIQTKGGTDEDHAKDAIALYEIEDAWVKNCTMLHFTLSGVITGTASRITVENCRALDPVCEISGGNRYNFNTYHASQQLLFKNCHASNGRHHYVSNGTSTASGNVFLDCTSEGAYTSSEGHRRWSQGYLFDNHKELDGPRPGVNPRLLGLYNRGYYGTSHGWSIVHSVAWACDVAQGDLIVQKPPTGQNYAIGCFGKNVTGKKSPAPFNFPEGYIEGTGQAGLEPRSLYEAQLDERLNSNTDIEIDKHTQPRYFVLQQNYPNPFNPATTIPYSVLKKEHVNISIYNVRGEKILTLTDRVHEPGSYSINWDGMDKYGNKVPTGVYFNCLQTDNFFEMKKMIMIK